METVLDDTMNYTVPPADPIGSAAYAAQWSYQQALKVISFALLVALVIAVAGDVVLARRSPVVIVVRVDDAGRAQAIQYNTANYTPREAEVRSRLNDWATFRYRLLKQVVGDDFKLNYYYLSGALTQQLLQADTATVAKALAAQDEQDVVVNNVQFTSFDTRKLSDGSVGRGEAVIDMTRIANPVGTPERQHWTATVRYEVNPTQAAQRGITEPRYQLLNPLGVTITWFHEDRAFN